MWCVEWLLVVAYKPGQVGVSNTTLDRPITIEERFRMGLACKLLRSRSAKEQLVLGRRDGGAFHVRDRAIFRVLDSGMAFGATPVVQKDSHSRSSHACKGWNSNVHAAKETQHT